MIVVVTGLPGAGKTTLARALASALSRPLFSLDAIKEEVYDAPGGAKRPKLEIRLSAEAVLAALLGDARSGSVVDIWLDPTRADRDRLRAMLPPGPSAACEVFCQVTAETSVRRYAERRRHAMHRGVDPALVARIEEAARLMAENGPAALAGLGPVMRVDTSTEVDVPDIVARVRNIAGASR